MCERVVACRGQRSLRPWSFVSYPSEWRELNSDLYTLGPVEPRLQLLRSLFLFKTSGVHLMAIMALTACSFMFFYFHPCIAGLKSTALHMQGRALSLSYILPSLVFCCKFSQTQVCLKLRLWSAETQAYTSHTQHSALYHARCSPSLKINVKK